MTLSIVIPAYNEETAIGETIDEVMSVLEKSSRRYELIVVDDGSTDETAARADKPGVRIIRHRRNRGYGASLKTGTLAARGDVVEKYDVMLSQVKERI